MNMLGIGKIDDLHKEYELQKREVYIKNTSNAICELGYIAEKLESAYETKYRLDPSYKNEYETQRNLSRLARDYFQAVGRFEKCVQEGVCLGEKIREWGAALALVAELQRILHRPDETGTTLLKLHEKGKLNLFVDPNRGPEWRFLDDWESQRDAAANTAKAEAQRAISATMQHFDFDVEAIRLMLMRCFGKSMSACMGKPGDHYCNYRLNTSSLSSTHGISRRS